MGSRRLQHPPSTRNTLAQPSDLEKADSLTMSQQERLNPNLVLQENDLKSVSQSINPGPNKNKFQSAVDKVKTSNVIKKIWGKTKEDNADIIDQQNTDIGDLKDMQMNIQK